MNALGTKVWLRCPATITLAVLTVLAYLAQVLADGDAVQRAVGLIPRHVSNPSTLFAVAGGQVVPAWATLVTYQFPHGAWWHLTLNLLGLLLLGRLAEPVLGTWQFALGYVASGIVCGVTIVVLGPSWTRPFVGASGAICGVLGGFLALRLELRPGWTSVLLGGELAGAVGLTLWVLLRASPAEPDRCSALLWHLIPFLVGWLSVRSSWCLAGRGHLLASDDSSGA
jgi:membrane associated rhomboid family serine protease